MGSGFPAIAIAYPIAKGVCANKPGDGGVSNKVVPLIIWGAIVVNLGGAVLGKCCEAES